MMRDRFEGYRSPVAEFLDLLQEELTETGRVAHLSLTLELGERGHTVRRDVVLDEVKVDLSLCHPRMDPVNQAITDLSKWIRATRSSVWGLPPKE